mgnify:CR=1 FL=1
MRFCRRRARAADRSSLPEALRWDAERPVEAGGCILPGDDHRQLRDGVVVVALLEAREQLVVDVAVRVRDRVGVFERHLLRVAACRTLAALQRKESRGGHTRDDYPNADAQWGKVNLVIRPNGNAEVGLTQAPLPEMPDDLKELFEEAH